MYQLNPLIESTVARRLVDSGKITDPKTIRMMIRKGWLPTKKRTVRGLRRSATNVAKKLGYKPVTKGNSVLNSFSVPYTKDKTVSDYVLGQSTAQAQAFGDTVAHKFKQGDMFIPHDPSRYTYKAVQSNPMAANPLQAAAVSWHEGREAARQSTKNGQKMLDISKKFLDKMGKPGLQQKLNDLPPDKAVEVMNKIGSVQSMGGHYPGVMRDEARLDNMLRRRYGVSIQDNVTAGVGRSAQERALGQMTAKQDLKHRTAAYDDILKYIDTL